MNEQQQVVGEAFAEAVCRKQWKALYPLMSRALQAEIPAATAAKHFAHQFGWKQLGPALVKAWNANTGESVEDDELDPPKRYEVDESEGRHEYSPSPVFQSGLTQPKPRQKAVWFMIDFLPDEDSDMDHCYRCYLCVVKESGEEKIAGYLVEPILD